MRPTNSGGKNPNPQPVLSPPIEPRNRSNVLIKGAILGAKASGKTTLVTGTFPTANDKKI